MYIPANTNTILSSQVCPNTNMLATVSIKYLKLFFFFIFLEVREGLGGDDMNILLLLKIFPRKSEMMTSSLENIL